MSATQTWMRRAPLLTLMVLVGCTGDNVLGPDRPGTWRPMGANYANLQAQVADPAHLDRGVAAATERGAQGADPVTRLLEDRRRALPITRTTNISSANTATAAGGR